MSTSAEFVRSAPASQPANGVHAAPVAETVLRPAVDIFEDAEGITLHADMPGVSKERLNVHVDGTKLLLEGTVQFANGSQPEPGAQERATRYRRSFALSRELETERIEAKVKDGVLTVRIPKRAEHQPRRIEIR